MEHPQDRQTEQSAPGRRTFRFISLLTVCFLGIALVLVFIYIQINRPVNGTIIQTKQPTVRDTPTTKTLTTPYYSLQYPVNYDLEPRPTASASLSAEVLKARQQNRFGTGSRITITVEPTPDGGVTEHSSYKLYMSQPDIYTVMTAEVGGENTISASRVDPNFEKTILWEHGKYLLTVTLIADTSSSTLDAELQTILTSLIWQ
ncbi:MAG TPA: hypothetical protein VF575_03130 [Candidatus Saccharimonadales bacterium]|jgi:hypothetical protein